MSTLRLVRLAVLGLLLAGCVAAPAATPVVIAPAPAAAMPTDAATAIPSTGMHTMTVEITLFDPTLAGRIASYGDTECAGDHGYGFFNVGIKATITDADGTFLGVAAFGQHGESIAQSGAAITECRWASTSVDVPESPTYAVDFGRGCLQFTLADLTASGWVAEMRFGETKTPRPVPTGSASYCRPA